jgi:transposase
VLFEPLMPVLYDRQMTEKRFHGDETRWEVFEEVEGKTGHRWYLWVMQSVSVVYYRMAPGGGAEVVSRIDLSQGAFCPVAQGPTQSRGGM